MINSLPLNVLVQIVDTLPVRLFWKDRDSRFLGCNQLFAQDAGIADPREFVGKSDYFFTIPIRLRLFATMMPKSCSPASQSSGFWRN